MQTIKTFSVFTDIIELILPRLNPYRPKRGLTTINKYSGKRIDANIASQLGLNQLRHDGFVHIKYRAVFNVHPVRP